MRPSPRLAYAEIASRLAYEEKVELVFINPSEYGPRQVCGLPRDSEPCCGSFASEVLGQQPQAGAMLALKAWLQGQ